MSTSLVRGRHVICGIDSAGKAKIVENGAVLQRDGVIEAIGSYESLSAIAVDEIIGSDAHVVCPGFINGHHHVGLTRWFAELTRKQIQRGVHTSVRQLETDIRTFIDLHNRNPKPFKWTKSADQILASVKRFCHKAQLTLCGRTLDSCDYLLPV
jgi:hypothetical protein